LNNNSGSLKYPREGINNCGWVLKETVPGPHLNVATRGIIIRAPPEKGNLDQSKLGHLTNKIRPKNYGAEMKIPRKHVRPLRYNPFV